jgi:hypothetical protein
MPPVTDSLLAELVHDPLRAVTFNQEGVILDFGDAWFTVHVWPTVRVGDATYGLGDRGYRDALCALIGHEVTAVAESPQEGLTLGFGLGSITTNPEPTDLSGPEVAQLAIYDPMNQIRQLAVWRAGEAPFAGSAWS